MNIKTAPFPGFPTDLQAPFTALMSIAKGDSKISETIFENRMSHVDLLNQMGASIKINKNTAHIKGVKQLNGNSLIGSDLRSSAALIIAAIMAKNTSSFYGLENLDRGYENFESKLTQLGVKIKRVSTNRSIVSSQFKESKEVKNSRKFQAA